MIPLLTRDAVRALDQHAASALGVSGLLLMENAGAGAARFLQEVHGARLGRVVILGGVGQNGGDAWVVARHLLAAGVTPQCWLLGPHHKVTGDARVNLETLHRLGCAVGEVTEARALHESFAGASVIVDGLFGTGLDRPLTGLHASVVGAVNESAASVFSLDLPSGIHADTGQILGAAVQADHTATFAALKRGLSQHPGAGRAGVVRCVSIGVPAPSAAPCGQLTLDDLCAVLRPRADDAHKGTAGHVLVVAGEAGHTGAALLAAFGAQRAGAGLVTVLSDAGTVAALESKVVEVMTAELGADALASALEQADGKAACVVGPGLGRSAERRGLALGLARELACTAVLDADALTAHGGQAALLQRANGPRILTPHPAEAARLLGWETQEVQADRYGAARELAARSGQVSVLKGARSIVASPAGELRVCPFGSAALASGGTGDVLAGVIGALSVELTPFEAAWVGTCVHALAGDQAARADRGLLASEVAACVPQVLSRCLPSTSPQ